MGITSVPYNLFGYQYARSGVGYVGIHCFFGDASPHREYVQAPLLQALEIGKKYCVSFFVSLSNRSEFAVSNIGMHFSKGSLTTPTSYKLLLNVTPQIENSSGSILNDTANWVKISGILTASDEYDHITIGNFHDNANTNYIIFNSAPEYPYINFSYYYIDDVSVVQIPDFLPQIDTIHSVCKNESYVLRANTLNAEIIKWYKYPQNILLGTGDTLLITPANNMEILVVTEMGECILESKVIKLNLNNQYPDVDLGEDTILCEGEIKILNAENPGSHFAWSTHDTSQSVVVSVPDNYWVKVFTAGMCPAYDTISIGFCDPKLIIIPNLVTINGDSINDSFTPLLKNIKDFKMQIYNRWGDKVFETNEYKGWNGDNVSDGIYFWQIQYAGYNSSDWEKVEGWVEVRR